MRLVVAIVIVVVIPGAKFGADDPEVVHVFAARGTEASNHGTARAFGLRGMSSSIGPHDRLRPFGAGIVDSRGDFMKWTAFADGFVDGTAGTPTQTA